jgi:hypothetical protein
LQRIQIEETDNAQHVWLKVMALKNEDDEGHLDISFYGLTHVNNITVRPPTGTLAYHSGNTCELSIPVVGLPNTTKFRFNHIPTITHSNDLQAELGRFCSKHSSVTWTRLQGFGAAEIYVLQFLPYTFVTHQRIRPILPPCITFIFPPLDTLEDRVQLEESAASRHHCTLIPCTDFIVCPTTFEEPEGPPHKHCTNKHCVRFFEKS